MVKKIGIFFNQSYQKQSFKEIYFCNEYLKNNDPHLIIYRIIFCNSLITFRHNYYAKYVFEIFNMVDGFQIFVISRGTATLIVSNF